MQPQMEKGKVTMIRRIETAVRKPGEENSVNQCCGPGSGMNIPHHISDGLKTIFWVKNTYIFYADPDPGSGIFFTLNPGYGVKKIRIRDKHRGSAALMK
jgi:hypothetical protein